VCPWNKFAAAAQANLAFAPRAELTAPALADLLALDDAAFREVFAGSPIKRIGRDRMVRNCLIAAGNSGSAALVEPVRALLDDSAPEIRGAAIWALVRLDSVRFAIERDARLSAEEDAEVREEWCASLAMPASSANRFASAIEGDRT
jgi:epoxyqueuosine reductase